MSKSPIVGDVVIFYEHGLVNSVPNAAVVTSVSSDLCVNLMILPDLNANPYAIRACYHVGCQVSKNVRTRFGGWESHEEYASRLKGVKAAEESRKKAEELSKRDKEQVFSDSDNHAMILKLHKEGNEVRKICELVSQNTGQAWNFNRVRSIINKASK